MSKITISGDTKKSKEEVEAQLLNLVRSRLSAIKEELSNIDQELNILQEIHGMDNEAFSRKFNDGVIGDNREFFVWDGLLSVRDDLLSEQETLRELL